MMAPKGAPSIHGYWRFPASMEAEVDAFWKEHEEVFLEVDETTEVKVWCFPTQTGGVEPLGRDGLLKSR